MPEFGLSFAFNHPDLRRPGVEFVRDEDRAVILRKDFGELHGTFRLDGLPISLDLPPDHPDLPLLKLLPGALLYTRRVAHGDPVPSELLNGAPSWTPRAEILEKSTSLVFRTLQGRFAALQPGEALPDFRNDGGDITAMADFLAGRLANATRDDIAQRLQQIALDLGRVEWLRRATSSLQRTVGEIAQYSAQKTGQQAGDLARKCALTLRRPTIWATELAMIADASVADINRLLADPSLAEKRVWPAIRDLRAFILDVEPILQHWAGQRKRTESMRGDDWKALLRRVTHKYATFDPALYRHSEPQSGFDPGAAND